MTKLKTAQMARAEGLPVYTLLNWIRYGLIRPPERDCTGHYWWGAEDIDAVRRVIAERRPGRSRDAVAPATAAA
jgi:DNA-binding transcriptional MerR regulator